MPIHSRLLVGFAAAALMASVAACTVSAPSATVTAADADRFLADANQTLLRLGIERAARELGRAELHHDRHRGAGCQGRSDRCPRPLRACAKESVKFDHVDVSARGSGDSSSC